MATFFENILTYSYAFVVLGSFVYATFKFYHTRLERKGRGVIIAEYEAPDGVRPAMVEVIIKGNATSKLCPVTIVDLAYRKYIKIEEDTNGKDISMTLEKDFQNDPSLYSYEKLLLSLLFSKSKTLSLYNLRTDTLTNRSIIDGFFRLKSNLIADVYRHTDLYKKIEDRSSMSAFMLILIFLMGIHISIFEFGYEFNNEYNLLVWFATVIVLYSTFIFAGASSSLFHKKGFILKEKIEGFRLYLEIVDKERLENMPADLFQENLAYAMAFGLEKKWSNLLLHRNATVFRLLSNVFTVG